MVFDLEVVARYLPFLLQGVGITVEFTLIAFSAGSILGLLLALARISKNPIFHYPAVAYIDFVRGTPLLAQIYLIHFGLPQIFGYTPVGYIDALLALTLNSTAYIAEIMRAGIESIDRGQMEAARSLGMTYVQSMRYVILPQALRRVVPPMGNEFIALLKESSLVSVIGMEDLMMRSRMMAGRSFRPFEAYFTAALIYLALTLTFSRILGWGERRLGKSAQG
ncbi:MAG TPA: amino acid ABC transporter permease [Firmicutes bacterium]|nr:amino acid ABC transporter permease [Candidatus Fermentithermobacillaceae bacterium]